MTILVTGGAGYIGSHTCVELLGRGMDIVIADNFSNSSPVVPERINSITGKEVKLYEGDVKDEAFLDRIFSENDIYGVIHFAGYKAIGESVEKPLMYYENNIGSTISLLNAMERANVRRLIFSSTASVYYEENKVCYSEDDPVLCTNPYSMTKLMIEGILKDLSASDKRWRICALRYFNPIGAHKSGLIGEDPKGIPNNLLPYVAQVAVGKREKLGVFGNDYPTPDGTGIRDYIHVCDLARGHALALEKLEELSGFDIINLGSGKGTSVLEVVSAFEKASGRPVPYEIKPRRSGDKSEYFCNPEKAKRILDFETVYDIFDMCKDTWNWQEKNPDGYNVI